MKISGFTMLRNGTKFDYPYIESIKSLLPLVDEMIVNVGIGEDDTLEQIKKLTETVNLENSGKMSWFESKWDVDDLEKMKGGMILSEQTNLALSRCSGDWLIHLQADEILHEQDYPALLKTLQTEFKNPEVEGLLFDYIHFYGSFDVIQFSRSAYRREVRAVKKSANPKSVGDAQSFRKADGSKLKVAHARARIFHYGWVRSPEAMRGKTFFMDQLYHGPTGQEIPHTGDNYRYKRFWGLKPFSSIKPATHPSVMSERIKKKGWHWDLKASPHVWTWQDAKKIILDTIEKLTGYRLFEYRSYKLIK